MLRTVCVALFCASATQGFGYVTELQKKVKVETEMAKWNEDFAKRSVAYVRDNNLNEQAEGYTECFEVQEIEQAFLCASLTQVSMNKALLRASEFVEGNAGTPGQVMTQAAAERSNMLRMIGGHDLRSQDLKRYWDAMSEKCEADTKYCPGVHEKQLFEEFLLPKMDALDQYVVITFASQSAMSWRDVVTHEIMHAQYFLQAGYQETTDDYWRNNVSEDDKKNIRQILSRYYDAKNEDLMKNEFQAYMLMTNAERNLLSSLVAKHRAKLLETLNTNGIEPVQIK